MVAGLPRANMEFALCGGPHSIWQINACMLLLLSRSLRQARPCDARLISLTHGISELAGLNPCFQRGGYVPRSHMQIL